MPSIAKMHFQPEKSTTDLSFKFVMSTRRVFKFSVFKQLLLKKIAKVVILISLLIVVN